MEKPSYFSILTADVRYDRRLGKPNARELYSEITALSNKDGYCHASNGYFARLYEVDNGTVSRWISTLEECGYLEREIIYHEGTKQVKERRLYPISTPIGGKHNTPPQKKQEGVGSGVNTPPLRKRKENNTSINNINNNRSTARAVDCVSEKQLKEDFEKLWKLYPRKEGKKKAFEAYKRAIKKDTTNKDIQTGIISYLKHINAQSVAKQYIKQGSTWFNGECWNDEYIVNSNSSPVNQKNNNSSAPEKRTVADIEKERRERRRDAFPIQYKNHPEWFTDEAIEDIIKEFPELREKVLEIDRARTKSDSSTT